MKPRKPTAILILLTFLALMLGCKKDGSAISIEGFYMTDNVGNYIGQHGPADDDWTLKTSLSAFLGVDKIACAHSIVPLTFAAPSQ